MSEFKPTLTPELRARLLASVDRLARLLRLNAPDVILANEVGLLYRKALAGLGPAVWEALHGPEYIRARSAAGLCARCDSLATFDHRGREEPLCNRHQDEQDRFEREADRTGEYDWGPGGPPGDGDG
jgi:hypothetical protein